MPPTYDPQYDIYHRVTDPAEQWVRDRGIIASWLKLQADTGANGAERRQDGTSNASVVSPELGTISVHDYWSFCRPDFQPADRQQSYLEILTRQVPILSFDYVREKQQPERSGQLVVFLNGEMDVTQGYAETFAPFTRDQPAGCLIAVESDTQTAGQTAVEIYQDEFFRQILITLRRAIMQASY